MSYQDVVSSAEISGKNLLTMNEILRQIFIGYFVIHIPITILVDLQGAFAAWYPQALRDVNSWYIAQYGDFLMATTPTWFRAFIVCEAVFQFPFFFVAVYGLVTKKNWIRAPLIAYGAHVATTVFPILMEFVESTELAPANRLALFGFYLPFLIVPLTIMIYMCVNEEPFGNESTSNKKRK